MPSKTRSYRTWQAEQLTDPEVAASYLNAAMKDSPELFLKAIRNVAQAHQMTRVATQAGVKRETLYRSFSAAGNPTLETLLSVLSVFRIEPIFSPKGEARVSRRAEGTTSKSSDGGRLQKAKLRHRSISAAGQLQLPFPSGVEKVAGHPLANGVETATTKVFTEFNSCFWRTPAISPHDLVSDFLMFNPSVANSAENAGAISYGF